MDTYTEQAKKLSIELGQNWENLRDDLKNGATVNELREFYKDSPDHRHNSHINGLAHL